MKQQSFESLYSKLWQDFEQQVSALETARSFFRTSKNTKTSSKDFPQLFRKICHLRSMADERHYSSNLVQKLDSLVARGYQVLYRPRPSTWQEFADFVVRGFPRAVRAEKRLVLLALLIFVLPGLLYGLAVLLHPELIYSLLSADQVSNMESMYRVDNTVFGLQRGSDSDVKMFGFYIQNNIGVAFRTFASGLLCGVGSIFFGMYNGLMLGGVSGHMINLHYSLTFFSFVITHSSFELTALVLACAAGLRLGAAMVSPGQLSRSAALAVAGKSALHLVYGVMMFLLIAAFIEAFWSSSSNVSSTLKFVIGSLCWFLVLYYLCVGGNSKSSSAALPD